MIKYFFVTFALLLSLSNSMSSKNLAFIENKGQLINSEGQIAKEVKFYNNQISPAVYLSDSHISFVSSRTKNASTRFTDIKFGVDEKINIEKPELYRFDVYFEGYNTNSKLIADEQQNFKYNYYLSHCPDGIENVGNFEKAIYMNIYPNTDFVINFKDNILQREFLLENIKTINDIKLRFEGIQGIEIISRNTIKIIIPNDEIILKLPDFFVIDENKHKTPIEYGISVQEKTISFFEGKNANAFLDLPSMEWSTYAGGVGEDKIMSAQFDNFGNIIAAGFSYSSNFPTTPGVWQEQLSGPTDIIIMKFTNSGEIIWSTFFGSLGLEYANALKADKINNYWIVGECRNDLFPVTNDAFQKNYIGGTADGIIIKLSDQGKRLYATYYGGSNYDTFSSLAFDSKNNLWLATRTNSRVFPCTPDAIKSNLDGEYDGVIIQMTNDGKQLYSTYFGGEYDDFYESLVVDSEDNVIVSGYSSSPNYFTTSDAYQKTLKEYYDAVLTKFSKDKKVIWSTFFGGSGYDYGSNIAIDVDDNLFIHGYTSSTNLPSSANVYQSKYGGGVSDCFLAKFKNSGNLEWVTYVGGSGYEGEASIIYTQFGNVVCSKNGKIAIAARTLSNDLKTTPDAFQKNAQGGLDAFFGIFNPDGTASTVSYLGGSKGDNAFDIDIFQDSVIIIAGITESLDFPLKNAFQSIQGGGIDGFIIKFGNKSDCPYPAFDYKDFRNIKQLNFSGFAHQKDNIIRLTKTKTNEAGAVWFNQKLPLQYGFSTNFSFKFSEGSNNNCKDNSEEGADGIALVIHNSNPYAIGWSGGGLGYDGIKNSLAIEFDTFSNDSTQLENLFDPNGNHIAVQCNGINENTSKHLQGINLAMNSNIPVIRSNGRTYYVSISYNPKTKTLIVYFDSTNYFKSPAIVLKDFDLSKSISLDNNASAYIGITGATGCAFQNQDILNWNLCIDQPFVTGVDENYKESDEIFQISPNPAHDRLIISSKMELDENIDIKLVDIIGVNHNILFNHINEISNNSMVIDLKDIPAGFYILRITQKNISFTKKIIVTK
ncbi:MAG: T9SS type A sorting domain-containing protein [Candidatus Kapabacteria bacterium]|nr:T9SS type A sorting domain-containing protein [Candidatus Kapabacteria bacterium]